MWGNNNFGSQLNKMGQLNGGRIRNAFLSDAAPHCLRSTARNLTAMNLADHMPNDIDLRYGLVTRVS